MRVEGADCLESPRLPFSKLEISALRLNPEPRTRAAPADAVTGIGELAAIERQTSAAGTFGQAQFHPFEFRNPLIDPFGPRARQLRPVGPIGCTIARQLRELAANFLQRQSNLLSKDNEGDATDYRARIAAVARVGPL